MKQLVIALLLYLPCTGYALYAQAADHIDAPAWREALPGTKAFIGDDGADSKSAVVCKNASDYREYQKIHFPTLKAHKCRSMKRGLPAVIEEITYDPVEDMAGTMPYPLIKVYMPSEKFHGYLGLKSLRPAIPPETIIHLEKKGALEGGYTLEPGTTIKTLKFMPASGEHSLYVEVMDGEHASQKGWFYSFFADSFDAFETPALNSAKTPRK